MTPKPLLQWQVYSGDKLRCTYALVERGESLEWQRDGKRVGRDFAAVLDWALLRSSMPCSALFLLLGDHGGPCVRWAKRFGLRAHHIIARIRREWEWRDE